MKLMKKGLAVIIVIVFIASLFAACGRETVDKSGLTSGTSTANGTSTASGTSTANTEKKEPITLTYLCANENFPDNFKELITNYENKSGNKVDVQLFPAPEYDKMIRTKMMSQQNFDLYRTGGIRGSEFNWPTDWPVDLTNREWVSRLDPSARKIIEWSDGRITGLPITNNGGFGLMYNKDIFDKVGIKELPKTWKEFLDVCEKIKAAGIIPVNIQLASGNEFGTSHLMHQLLANIWITHKDDISDMLNKIETNKLKFSQIPEFEQALNQMIELKEKGYTNKDFISTTYDMSQDKFGKGEVAMHPCGDFILQPMLSKYPDLKVGLFPAPFGDTQGVIAAFSGVSLAVSSKAKYKEQALEFMDFFASKEEQEKYMAKSPGIGVFSDVKSVHNMISADIEKYALQSEVYPGMFDISRVWPELEVRKLLQEMMLGSKTPEQILEEIDKKAEIVAKGKSLPGW